MKKRFIILCFVVIITLSSVVFAITVNAKNSKTSENISEKKVYTLKDYNGNPAVFENGGKSPIYVLDITTDSLPERDAQRIKNGITAATKEEIFKAVEDYE